MTIGPLFFTAKETVEGNFRTFYNISIAFNSTVRNDLQANLYDLWWF